MKNNLIFEYILGLVIRKMRHNMQSLFLSIIIPTYNNHISDMIRCLDSVYDTAYQDFEVLIIDDGSEVSYQVELDQVETRYERLMVLHKAHAGVSAARNFGVQKAQGDYILFVDADDVVTKQFWRDVWKTAEDRTLQADIVYGLVNDGKADGYLYVIVRNILTKKERKSFTVIFLL